MSDSMKKTTLYLMLITALSKFLGFTRDITLSYFYGTSSISDAYLISSSIPLIIFTSVGIGVSTGYIPMYSRILKEYGEKEGIRYTNSLVNILVIICTAIVGLSLLFTEEMVSLFASGFVGETLDLTVQFTRISLFGIYFTGIIYVFRGFLQIRGSYIVPELIGFPLNITIILSIIFSYSTSIVILPIGVVLANITELLFLLPFVYKKGYRYKLEADIKNKHIIRMTYLALPIIIGSSVDQINIIVDRTIASNIAVGGVSALNYSFKLNSFIHGIFVTSLSTVMYSKISKMAAYNHTDSLKKTVSEAINLINLLVVPTTVGAMTFAEPIVRLLFGRGAFDLKALEMTSNTLFFYSIGMVGFGLRDILSRAFYSLQDIKTPVINATIAMALNIILNVVLSRLMGIGGLALSTSISAVLCAILLFISFRNKIGSLGMKNIAISFMKITCASMVMGLIAKIAYDILPRFIGDELGLIGSICIGAIVYFIIIFFMNIDEVNTIVSAFKNKFKKSEKKTKTMDYK